MSTAILLKSRQLIRPVLLAGSRPLSLVPDHTRRSITTSSTLQRTRPSEKIRAANSTSQLFGALATASLASLCISSMVSCEDQGPADETEDSSNGNIIIQDGIDAGQENPSPNFLTDEVAIEEDDDDPSNDEETTCSICLINRQGPCRKYWLKFERCMKDHSAEKDKKEKEDKDKTMMQEVENREPTLEEEWDGFMEKSVTPGEDDDDDDDDDDEGDEETSEGHRMNENNDSSENTDPSLGERCDKFMIPWISCIQEHRNVYSLISNAFYQKDYVDPLEESVSNNQRRQFARVDSSIGEKDGYVIKFIGAEIDLGNWREHVEADAEENEDFIDEERSSPQNGSEEPDLINAYAKFKLTEPETGNPIEVAYIKDQKGRLLGFDSFSKRDIPNNEDENNMHSGQEKVHDGSTMEQGVVHDGECTFHIVPEETTSIAAYAIYRSKRVDDNGEEQKDFTLHYTPQIPLPGNKSDRNNT